MEVIYIKLKKNTLLSILLIIVGFSNSCSLFKNKDDCDTCPKWSLHESDLKNKSLNK